MLRWRASTDDDEGSAALEFILAGLVLLVPIVYLIVALGVIQGHSLGVEAAARHSARALATAAGPGEGSERVERVLDAITAEYDIDPEAIDVQVHCGGAGGTRCPDAGATITVTVRAAAALPLVPPVLGLDRVARIPVEAISVQKVSRFWRPE